MSDCVALLYDQRGSRCDSKGICVRQKVHIELKTLLFCVNKCSEYIFIPSVRNTRQRKIEY